MSQRHAAAAPVDPRDDALLDAARASVLAVGVRRTTAADIARRAGVSRMTLYRRFPDAAGIIQALMTREFGGLLERAAAETADRPTGRERVVAGVVRTLELLDGADLLHRILDVDPELLLPYATQRVGAFQQLALERVAGGLRAGMADGSVRLADPGRLAATIELAMRAHVLAAHADERTLPAAEARAELGAMLDAYLAPRGAA
jgi:AcrR family transcriptional regulator